ncbi:MAG TPA: histidine kinase, partial [Saprospiraceae bacterium]|nr:histidine kinase [Saprospiraceae bacterium]
LDFTRLTDINYYYRLTGVDKKWNNSHGKNFATYTDLKPGDYTFEVRSENGFSSSPITSFSFSIATPWWATWWIKILAVCCVLGLAFIAFRTRIRTIRQEASLKHKIAETEMMALRSQMNPHFIFNCINGIDAMIQSNDKYRATMYLNKFAKLIRNILDSSKQNKIPLSKDLETLQLYIDLELFRHQGKFTANIHAEEDLLQNDYVVPPLIIQPYVENAILHGLRHRAGNEGKLSVTVRKGEDHIIYTIEDNGVGRKNMNGNNHHEGPGYGMQIGNDRVRLFNKEEIASVNITDRKINGEPSGTCVEVKLRLH